MSKVNIFARLRVIMPWESDAVSCTHLGKSIHNRAHKRENAYEFTDVFGPQSPNEQVFEDMCAPMLEKVMDGFNGILIAYGQTGSGKTYSVLGKKNRRIPGLLLLSMQYLLSQQTIYKIELSAVESFGHNINKVSLFDLCDEKNNTVEWKSKGGKTSLDPMNCTRIQINSMEEAEEIIERVHDASHFAPTGKNPESSRGHVAFVVRVTQREANEDDMVSRERTSYWIVVDLAGSEGESALTQEFIEQMDSIEITQRRLEAGCINHGLSQLQVIFQELKRKKKLKKTVGTGLRRILHSFINVQSVLSVLFTISPSADNAKATESTLRFAEQCALVKCTPVKAKAQLNKDELIQKLRSLLDQKERIITDQQKRLRSMSDQIDEIAHSPMNQSRATENNRSPKTEATNGYFAFHEEGEKDPRTPDGYPDDVDFLVQIYEQQQEQWVAHQGMKASAEDVDDLEHQLKRQMSPSRRASRQIDATDLKNFVLNLRKGSSPLPQTIEEEKESSDEEDDELSDLSGGGDDIPPMDDEDGEILRFSLGSVDTKTTSRRDLLKLLERYESVIKESQIVHTAEKESQSIIILSQTERIRQLQSESKRMKVQLEEAYAANPQTPKRHSNSLRNPNSPQAIMSGNGVGAMSSQQLLEDDEDRPFVNVHDDRSDTDDHAPVVIDGKKKCCSGCVIL